MRGEGEEDQKWPGYMPAPAEANLVRLVCAEARLGLTRLDS